MPSYPAKPYVVPHDDWFNNNSSNYSNKSEAEGIKNISTIHEFFYKQSDVKVGGSDNHIETNLAKKSSTKIIISSLRNSDDSFLPKSEEKYSYSSIPAELKSIKTRSYQGKPAYKNLSNKNASNLRSYVLHIKSVFLKLIRRKKGS
tara:strand:+ start:113 stop:550 length:438 start_codon:yes stop_codon:yes gene_type:complete